MFWAKEVWGFLGNPKIVLIHPRNLEIFWCLFPTKPKFRGHGQSYTSKKV